MKRSKGDDKKPGKSDDAAKPTKPDYPIGYKRPPIGHRFKPGQSGNPAGRSKKASAGFLELLKAHLHKNVTVVINGQRTSLTRLEWLVQRLVGDALNGKSRALNQLLDLVNRVESTEQLPATFTFDFGGSILPEPDATD